MFELLFLLFFAQVQVDANVMGAFILAQVEDLKSAEVFAPGLELTLHANEPFARGVDGKLAQVTADPLAPQLFGYRQGGAGAAKEVGYQTAFVGRGFDDSFEQGFRFLSRIFNPFTYARL
ncbi:hypothetical protein SDC9_94573 [bioreactor metagenome]|uniref:Uncharacterized protein n=1 Tax=bioreactor metagenome TaxID=1076179 RepID=A0A645A459_9ZZZZ